MEIIKTKESVTDLLSRLETMQQQNVIVVITDAANVIDDDYIEKVTEAVGLKTELRLTVEMKKLGFKSSLSGFEYLKFGILLALKDRGITDKAISKFYPAIGKEFKISSTAAERSMRHSIEKAWEIGSASEMNRIFRYSIDPSEGRPSVMDFVCTMRDAMRLGQF